MPIPRSIASAAIALATTLVVIVPAQAGLAATPSFPTSTIADGRTVPQVDPVDEPAEPDVEVGPATEEDEGFGDDLDLGDAFDLGEDVPIVDGTDAEEDDPDALVDEASSSSAGSATAARRDRTSGRWARVALPSGVRATLSAASRAQVTWRAGTGGMPAQRFVVELRATGSVLRMATLQGSRTATLWGLVAGKRYTVTVIAVASDGTRRAAVGAPLRTPVTAAPKRASSSAKRVGRPVAARAAAGRPLGLRAH